jgi:hypothetical protein
MPANAAQAPIVSQVLILRELADAVAIRADTPVRPSSRIRQEARLVKPGTRSIVTGAKWFARNKVHHRGTETQRRKSTARRAKRCVPLLCVSVSLWGKLLLTLPRGAPAPGLVVPESWTGEIVHECDFPRPVTDPAKRGYGRTMRIPGRGMWRRATTLYAAMRIARAGTAWGLANGTVGGGSRARSADVRNDPICGSGDGRAGTAWLRENGTVGGRGRERSAEARNDPIRGMRVGRAGRARTAGLALVAKPECGAVQRPYRRYAGGASREGVGPRERHGWRWCPGTECGGAQRPYTRLCGSPEPNGVGPRERHGRRWRPGTECGGAQRPYTRHADRTSREGAGPCGWRGRRWWPSAECGGAQRPYMRHAGRRGRDGRGPRRRRATVCRRAPIRRWGRGRRHVARPRVPLGRCGRSETVNRRRCVKTPSKGLPSGAGQPTDCVAGRQLSLDFSGPVVAGGKRGPAESSTNPKQLSARGLRLGGATTR